MRLYDSQSAPNPRRVRVFLAEKGIAVPIEQVDITTAVNRGPEFRAKNPLGTVPVLELDDGTCIAESVAICRYFEETQPEPPLMGIDARDRAVVEMWQRRMEFELFIPIAQVFRNSHPFFAGRIPQVAEWGEVSRKHAEATMAWLDRELAGREFIAGPR
jgi:glutathione S-transferase